MKSQLRSLLALVVAAVLGLVGCDSTTGSTTTTQQIAQATTAAINANDFALGTVTSLISNGGVNDLGSLEAKINDASSGINNVDVDGDGQVDYVSIQESGTPGNDTLEFLAHPSSNPSSQPVLVASVAISTNTTTQNVQVTGAYPNYVAGYQDNSYVYNHQGLTFGQAVLLGALLQPHTYYVAPRPMYVSRPVLSGSSLGSTRSTFSTTTHVVPVQRTVRPSTYQAPLSASRSPSQYTAPRATGSITGNATQQRSFSQRSSTAPRPTGASFSSRPSSSYTPSTSRSSSSSSSSSSFSRSSSSRSSFGGGRRR